VVLRPSSCLGQPQSTLLQVGPSGWGDLSHWYVRIFPYCSIFPFQYHLIMRNGETLILKTKRLLSNLSLLVLHGMISDANSVDPGEFKFTSYICFAASFWNVERK
jgi:hypothetical protein